jgi:Na+-translocating ferredoxin:NAD+ oxidoreductase RnfC subunit
MPSDDCHESGGNQQDADKISACHTVPCDMCEDDSAGATYRCIECGLLCESCADSHAKMIKLFRMHKVRLLTPKEKEETEVRILIYTRHVMHAYVCVHCQPWLIAFAKGKRDRHV